MDHIEDIYELSPLQQGLLFQCLLAPEAGLYVVQHKYELRGELDIPALQQAWTRVIERTPVFRTAFYWEDLKKPVQVVYRDVELPWVEEDWRGLSADEQEQRLAAFLEADRRRGFTFTEDPLLRLHLFHMGDGVARLIVSTHHLLMDGWSVALMISEMVRYYETFAQGQTLDLEYKRPFKDYIAWLHEQDLAEAEAFWRHLLASFTAPTALPGEWSHRLQAQEEVAYGKQHIQLSEATTATLQVLAKQQKITLNTIVLGAWALLLSRYSGEEDVVFGTVLSGRPADLIGVESMIGMFINTLPIRAHLNPSADLLTWFQSLQAQQVEMRQYEYSPLIKVQEWSDVRRELPLFESILVFENYPEDEADANRWGELLVEQADSDHRTNYPLTILVGPGRRLVMQIKYDATRIEESAVTRILGHFETLLTAIADNPMQKLAELPMLTAREQQQLLVEWNDTVVDELPDQCLFELFEAQAQRTPDAVALVFEGETLTYAQLNSRANQVAHHLQTLGVGPEVLVGICTERSPEMVIGMMGILKAGGAYVPLDPDYPKERLAFMLEDSQVSVLLTQQRLAKSLQGYEAQLVLLDDETCFADADVEQPFSGATPQNMAYIIYTSGSTGKPKGVMVEHHAVCKRLRWMQKAYRLTAEDRLLQKAPFSFDASVWEIFLPLSVGGQVVIARPGGHQDTHYLVDLIEAQQVTAVYFIPSMLQVFLEEPDLASKCRSLKQVMCGGEALPYELQERFFARLDADLWNRYGPTEATINATYWKCQRASERRVVPMGRPLDNTLAYVLDPQMRPVPVGVAGELYVGGNALARGYLHRPELNAEKFVSNPFVSDPGARLYRSGDLVRYLPDGNIEFLGRLDDQVKIRGLRIELGEIEASLAQHPAIREAVVLVREDQPGDKRLVAYVVSSAEQAPRTRELQSFLKAQLPAYMVPAIYVVMGALPLTPSGKVDRKQLPVPAGVQDIDDSYTAPRDWIELEMVELWETVLQIRPIGIFDNYFELGGHSLLAVVLMDAVRSRFDREIPLATLFQHPTVADLCAVLREGTAAVNSCLIPIQKGNGEQRPMFLVHPGGGGVLCYFELARALGPEQTVYGICSVGLEWDEEPLSSVDAMSERYLQEMRAIQPQGPYRLGGWSFGGTIAFEMTRRLEALGEQVEMLSLLDVRPLGQEYGDRPKSERSTLVEWAVLIGLEEALFDGLDDEEERAIEVFLHHAQERNILPQGATVEGTRRAVRVGDLNRQATEEYVFQAGIQTDIHLFRVEEISPVSPIPLVDANQWRSRTTGDVHVITIPGDHHTLVEPPHVYEVAKALKAALEAEQSALASDPVHSR